MIAVRNGFLDFFEGANSKFVGRRLLPDAPEATCPADQSVYGIVDAQRTDISQS